MSLSLRRVGILTAIAAMVAAFIVAVGRPADAAGGHHERSYLVTVENLTETQLFTPTVVATHDWRSQIFRTGRPASDGVQATFAF